MKEKYRGWLVHIVIILSISVVGSAITFPLFFNTDGSAQTQTFPSKTYYLGDRIVSNVVYFHGFLETPSSFSIVFSHYMGKASSNIYIEGTTEQFYLKGMLFKVIQLNQMEGWIILQRMG